VVGCLSYPSFSLLLNITGDPDQFRHEETEVLLQQPVVRKPLVQPPGKGVGALHPGRHPFQARADPFRVPVGEEPVGGENAGEYVAAELG
jgi:hypothetical protein